MKILVTGGTGRLATELKKHLEGEYVGIEDWDFTYEVPRNDYDIILHMGAYTLTTQAEEEQDKCFQTNAFGTFKMVQAYRDTPFIYISTEYANNPKGVYAISKYLGEEIVKTHPHHLIIRTAFKPNPWPFDVAYIDQYTQGDYVDVIAELISKEVKTWDRKTNDFKYVGTGRKTIFELAQRTKPDVKPNRVNDFDKRGVIPRDYA